MNLDDASVKVRYLIRDRDAKHPALLDRILGDTGTDIVLTGVRMPRMNSIMERWVRTCRRELLDRTLIWNETHPRHCLHEFELHYNEHRPHQAMHQAAPLRTVPPPITDPERLARLDIRRDDRLGGIIHEYQHAA
jgi:transposase InsO family protein